MNNAEQQWLSEAYGSLKTRYFLLKQTAGSAEAVAMAFEVLKGKYEEKIRKNTELGAKCQQLETKNNELSRKLKEYEMLGKETTDVETAGYVKHSTYMKMKNLMEKMAGKVCDLSREIEVLKRMVKQ